MCLILFAYKYHPEYPLIVAANRDEFFQRPTNATHWWPDYPDLLAGKDLQSGGTWMGVSKRGLFAAVTNVREPDISVPNAHSRGHLPLSFLTQDLSAEKYSAKLRKTEHRYQGFNLLHGTIEQLYYHSNRSGFKSLNPGLYGLSNAELDTAWPKVQLGKEQMVAVLNKKELDCTDLLSILSDITIASDNDLPHTGVSLEWERQLSAICISAPEYGYGTRSSTVLIVDRKGQARLQERSILQDRYDDNLFEFAISKENRRLQLEPPIN